MTVANDHPVAYAATSVSDGIIGIIIKVKAGAQRFVGSSGGNAGEKMDKFDFCGFQSILDKMD